MATFSKSWLADPGLFTAATPQGALARGLASALSDVSNPLLIGGCALLYKQLLAARVRAADMGLLAGAPAVHARAEQQALAALAPGEWDRLVQRAWEHANGRRVG